MKCESEEVFCFSFYCFLRVSVNGLVLTLSPLTPKNQTYHHKKAILTQKSLVFSISQLSTKIFLEKMNVFRLLGDLSHLFAILLLLAKIWKSKSVTGLSGKSQVNLNLKIARFSHILTPKLAVYYLF